MLLGHRRLEEITEADLNAQIHASAQESETVEFTANMWGNGDEEKRDMLREITALKNHGGGELAEGRLSSQPVLPARL